MHGQQGLVGRDHVLAVGDRLHDQGFRQVVAANQFDDDVDLGIIDDDGGVVDHLAGAGDERFGARHVAHGDGDDFNAAARAALDFFLVALQDTERAEADIAQAQQADLDGFHSVLDCSLSGAAKGGARLIGMVDRDCCWPAQPRLWRLR
ncbi:hypothetical protein D3C81_392750 [compost metagenome]